MELDWWIAGDVEIERGIFWRQRTGNIGDHLDANGCFLF